MDPLSRKKRLFFFVFFSLIFFAIVPLFIFYAEGYRFNLKDAVRIRETGGIYVSTDQSGIEIYINNTLERKTSIIQKSAFVQDLRPGTYEVRVSKDGLQTWHKTLKVFPELVSEAHTFLIKDHPVVTPVLPYISSATSTATSSVTKKPVKNPEYATALALFTAPKIPVATSTNILASSTEDELSPARLVFSNTNGVLVATWKGEADAIPNYFCENTVCKTSITIHTNSPVLSYESYPGREDLVLIRLENGIYVEEIDDRSPQNTQPIVEGSNYEFRIKEGRSLYLKKGADIFSVTF
jgi:hypothetical protein